MTTRFKLLAIGAIAALCVAASATPLHFTMTAKDQKVGTLKLERTGNDTDGYTEESTLVLEHDTNKVRIHEVERYGSDGITTSNKVDVTANGHEANMKARLDEDGAHVTVWDGTADHKKDIPLATKTSRADPTDFWFYTTQPAVGTSSVVQEFDTSSLAWHDVTLTYAGDETIHVGGKDIKAHKLTRKGAHSTSTIYVDTKGDPLLFLEDGMRIERDAADIDK